MVLSIDGYLDGRSDGRGQDPTSSEPEGAGGRAEDTATSTAAHLRMVLTLIPRLEERDVSREARTIMSPDRP